jgi:hypothetical protein
VFFARKLDLSPTVLFCRAAARTARAWPFQRAKIIAGTLSFGKRNEIAAEALLVAQSSICGTAQAEGRTQERQMEASATKEAGKAAFRALVLIFS